MCFFYSHGRSVLVVTPLAHIVNDFKDRWWVMMGRWTDRLIDKQMERHKPWDLFKVFIKYELLIKT